MKIVDCNDEGLEETARVLLDGGLAIIPTDTVYGLAAHPGRADAVERLYEAKGRDRSKPIALLASGADAVAAAGFPLSGKAAGLAAENWPGALTLVVDNGKASEGFRVPDHGWTRRLLARCGGLLRTTSANLSGEADATTAADAAKSLERFASIAADGGPSRAGKPSKVVKVLPSGEIEILRA